MRGRSLKNKSQMRILYLLQFLYQSTNELCSILSAAILHCWEVHGICSDRKQAYKNIASLQDLTQILFASKARRIDASLAPAVWGIFFVHQFIVTGRREAQSLWHYIRVEEQRQFIVAFINRRFHFNTPFHWDRTVRQFLDWIADAGLGSFVNSRLDRRTPAGCLPHTPVACP